MPSVVGLLMVWVLMYLSINPNVLRRSNMSSHHDFTSILCKPIFDDFPKCDRDLYPVHRVNRLRQQLRQVVIAQMPQVAILTLFNLPMSFINLSVNRDLTYYGFSSFARSSELVISAPLGDQSFNTDRPSCGNVGFG